MGRGLSLALIVAVVGCSSDGKSASSVPAADIATVASTAISQTTEAVTVAPTRTEPATTAVEAPTAPPTPGEVYLDIVRPLNCGSQLLSVTERDAYGSDNQAYEQDWPKIQETLLPAFRAHADALALFVEALVGYEWPLEVQPDIYALAAESSGRAGWYSSVADSPTYDSFIAAQPPPARSAATVVRAKLGIPSNINSDVNWCDELSDGG